MKMQLRASDGFIQLRGFKCALAIILEPCVQNYSA